MNSKPQSKPRMLAAGVSCWLGLLLAPAAAQEVPHIDAVGAYNHANVMTQPREAQKSSGEDPTDLPPGGQVISQEKLDQIMAELQAGYRHRVRRDGKTSADVWLEGRVERLSRQYTTVK